MIPAFSDACVSATDGSPTRQPEAALRRHDGWDWNSGRLLFVRAHKGHGPQSVVKDASIGRSEDRPTTAGGGCSYEESAHRLCGRLRTRVWHVHAGLGNV